MRLLTLAALIAASSAAAQDGIRETDVRLTQAELTDYLSGQVLEFYTGGFATYRDDGRHDYRYSADGERVPGRYEVMDDSRVCVEFDNGFERCDYIVNDGQRHVMVIFNGERYPIRTRSAVE